MDMRAILIKEYDITGLMAKIENHPEWWKFARLYRYLDRIRFDLTETGVILPQNPD